VSNVAFGHARRHPLGPTRNGIELVGSGISPGTTGNGSGRTEGNRERRIEHISGELAGSWERCRPRPGGDGRPDESAEGEGIVKRAVIITSGLALSGLMLVAGMSMQPAKAAEGSSTAPPFLFLNVQQVFTDYKKFQQLSENLKAQLEAKEKQLMDMEQSIKGKADSIAALGNQTDRDNAQKEIQELKFDYEKTRRDARQEFLATEANMYATCYTEMYQLVEAYCQQHNYYVVFRVQEPDSKDKTAPNKILATLNREVIYNHPKLDITKMMVDGLNQQYEKAQARGGDAGAVR
jgi:Skp family chaperone for outer membrane proteins